jgi:diaminopimelate decarboxylase/aspartate kinase
MAEKWVVLKFGGTSVAGLQQWETIASLANARHNEGYRVLLVCSAVAGVTNRLTALANQPESKFHLDELLQVHRVLSNELGLDFEQWLPDAAENIRTSLARIVQQPGPSSTAHLMALGEWFSTRLGLGFLRKYLEVAWVDARDALEILPEPELSPARYWLSASCEPGQDRELAERWGGLSPILITQGFIARTPQGETALLGRGGSDTSAALLAGRLSAERLEIWTDVPGLFSADPRLIPEARLLNTVDYAEALEIAASGAKVVQSRCVRAAASTSTPILIKDVNRPDVEGTRIGDHRNDVTGVKTITCQENMAVILLQNLDARHQVGFLASVFEVFRRRGISVDLVATSETTTTVAVNCEANHLGANEISKLVDELTERCKVRLFDNCVCVNLVGHGARTALARLQSTMEIFEQLPLLMLSQSANDLCLSILVRSGDHEALLKSAHSALIPQGDDRSGAVFGLRWEQLQSVHESESS